MLKMQHDKSTGENDLTYEKSGNRAVFDNYFDAWLFVEAVRGAFTPAKAKA